MSKSYRISFSTKHQGFASFIPGIYTSLSGTNASTVDWELKRSRVMYLMWTCSCLSNHFPMVCFLKACHVPSGRGGINIKTCTCKLREALAFQLLGRDGSSAIRLAKHYEPRLREAAPSGDTAHTCHTMPYLLFLRRPGWFLGKCFILFPKFAMLPAFKPPKLS